MLHHGWREIGLVGLPAGGFVMVDVFINICIIIFKCKYCDYMSNIIDLKFSSMDEICLTLGSRLRAQRLAQNLQQIDLAQKAGVSKLTIINLENKGVVSLTSFIKVVRALGLIDELSTLFLMNPNSIAMMEALDIASKRKRASRHRQAAP